MKGLNGSSTEIKSSKRNRKSDKPRRQRGDISQIPPPFDVLVYARERDSLSRDQKRVLANLATYADQQTAECDPHILTQVRDTGLCRSVLCERLAELEKLGEIRREQRRGDYGTPLASRYTLIGFLAERSRVRPHGLSNEPSPSPRTTESAPTDPPVRPDGLTRPYPRTHNKLANELATETIHRTLPPNGGDYAGFSKKETASDNHPGGTSENATGNPSPGGPESSEPIVFSEGVVQLTRSKFERLARMFSDLPNIEAAIYTIALRLGPKNGGDWEALLEARLGNASRRWAVQREQIDAQRREPLREPKWGENYL